MPKMKTHKATAKRFKITGRRKPRRREQRRGHLRSRKSKRVLHELCKDLPVAKADRKRVRRPLGLRKRK